MDVQSGWSGPGLIDKTVIFSVDLFKGIPYAQPPVGSARWKPPMKLNSFDELDRDEVQHQTHCIPSQVRKDPIGTFL